MYNKHVVIIGGGLGGLSTAVILAKNGFKVTVLEQGTQVGGCLQCFSRKGARFETGMHFVGSCDEGQTLNRLMHFLELDDVELSELDPKGYDVISLGGKRYKFAKGRSAFINQMVEYFPHQRKNLERYYDLIETVANASSLHSLRYADSDVMVSAEYQLRSINDVIKEVITDPLLANVLVGSLPLYAAELDKTPFSVHAFIMDFYNQSAYRFVGGSDHVAHALVKTIEKYGGDVITKCKAVQICCDDTKAKNVLTADGRDIACDYVVSSAHPLVTLDLLKDTKLIRPAFRNRISNIPQTIGGFSVYIKFKKNTVPYINSNFYGYAGDSPWGCERYDDSTWPKGYMYMHLCHEPHPKFASSAVVLSYMQYADVKKWEGTQIGERGADYEAFKKAKAEKLINKLDEEFPGLKDSVECYFTATPLTYKDYLGAEGGGMYGVVKDIHNTAAYRVPQRTKVPNVFQTGQNINSHGMLGVLVGSIVTCSELIPASDIYKQIIGKADE